MLFAGKEITMDQYVEVKETQWQEVNMDTLEEMDELPFPERDNVPIMENTDALKTTEAADNTESSEMTEDADETVETDMDEADTVTDLEAEDAAKRAAEEAEEEQKRAEHEASEAKRKAEWEARQQAKREAERKALEQMERLTDEEVITASMKRVGKDTERLTRRNMKECVSEYVQTICMEDAAFARIAMHPKKNMINCFKYINRKAREFVEQEMKDNDIKPENVGYVYGSDIPDGQCYQWAEDYFRDPDVPEDKPEKEEEFVPKPYVGKTSYKPKKKAEKKKPAVQKAVSGKKPAASKQEETKPQAEVEKESMTGQMSLMDFFTTEAKAG